jgi:hypothetical protein
MIKNYTSNSKQTFDIIQKALATHGAKQVFFDYNDQGQVKALAFSLQIKDKFYAFRLPARAEKVERFFQRKDYWGQPLALTDEQKAQAYRTAWANIRDWLTAQLALIETEQVRMEEVFLPYMMTGKETTVFEDFQNDKLLPTGKI